MFKVGIVLACLAWVGNAQPRQSSVEPDAAQALAAMLLSAESTAAFNPSLGMSHPAALRKQSRIDGHVPVMADQALSRRAFGGAALAAMLGAAPAFGGVPEAAKDLTDAAYPIIGSLKKDTLVPLLSKTVGVGLTADPKEIMKTVDTGLDAFLSTSPEKFLQTVKALKAATAEASSASKCNLICLPSLETSEKVGAVAADALSTADPKKVKAFADQVLKTLNSADKFALAPLVIDGGKFAGSLNPGDVAKASAAALELAKASGAAQ